MTFRLLIARAHTKVNKEATCKNVSLSSPPWGLQFSEVAGQLVSLLRISRLKSYTVSINMADNT